MSRSPLAFDLVGPAPYLAVLGDDFLLQHGDGGEDDGQDDLEHQLQVEFGLVDDGHDHDLQNQNQLAEFPFSLDSSQSPSAGSASDSDDINLSISDDDQDVHLDRNQDFDYDSNSDTGSDSPQRQQQQRQQPPIVSSLSPSISAHLSLGPSPSPSPSPSPLPDSLLDSDSSADLDADQGLRVRAAPLPSVSVSGSDSSGFDLDSDSDSGPDQDLDLASPGSDIFRPPADLVGHDIQSQHRHRQHPQRQAPVEIQDLEDQHEEDHELEQGNGNENDYQDRLQDELPLREHLRLRRARRAARVAREAGRPHPARGNWRPNRPARRAVAGDSEDSGLEELHRGANMDNDDELVEVVYQNAVAAPPIPPRRQQRHSRAQRQQRQYNNNNNEGQDLMDIDPENVELEVIDLTEEPDSPVLHRHRPINILRHNNNHNHSHHLIQIIDEDDDENDNNHNGAAPYQAPRNPRRHMSQNGRMPSLNRSDGSILNGNASSIIDLTHDSPPDNNIPADRRLPPPAAAARLNQPANRNRRLPPPAPPAAAAAAPHRVQYQDFGRHLIGSIRGLLPGLLAQAAVNPREAEVQFVGAVPVPAFPMNPNPLAGNPPEFNYQANGFGGYGGRQPTPRPDFQAPPPPRSGFTRDTRPDGGDAGPDEEMVVICPSCDNELKYSPDDEDDNPQPAKKPRGKKSQEEHHFWAVKNCGHVYCKSCYDNRKKHSKGKESAAAKTGFRFQPSETSKSIKIFCAVDDCESEVSPNAAWVGIFM
ncbi:hypothetical protein Daus18300_008907 [Diaporthe australafricana]|uniref:Cell cycle control protein n=1 Tax=Diaporthe australafricana TaxID=127596 RepID=A0ABR3WGK8_9PEZI